MSPEFEVKGFVGETITNKQEFSIDNEKLTKFSPKTEQVIPSEPQTEISEYKEKLNSAWDQILNSLKSAEDWEKLTPEEWENMLKPPAFF